ncbi:MAG: sigma-54 dependent transcriptional regulator [Chromatiales bacterium]|nr:sigma-54 dependent transcriptional regulator [Chromatiales bacterium]
MSTPQIMVVDDEADIRSLLQEILSDEGYEVRVAADAEEARQLYAEQAPDLILLDIWMPGTDGISLLKEWVGRGLKSAVVMMSGHGTVDAAMEATRLGAFDFIEKPLSLSKLLRSVQRGLDEGRPSRETAAMQLASSVLMPIGKSEIMRNLRQQILKVAPHDTPVMLLGESGAGREAFARYLHSVSDRSKGPFVSLAAGTLTEENADGLLLGVVRENGSDAGYLERAQGGTLYINELEDLCPRGQTVLLSVLEQGGFIPQNSTEAVPLNVRLLASANQSVESSDSPVRRDLLSHISVLSLKIPPLRDYSEDVPELLKYYVDKMVDQDGLPYRQFSVAAQNRLRNYPWPGNVRELRNLVHRLLISGEDESVSLEEIESELQAAAAANEPLVKQDLLALPLREAREHFERAYLQQQLILSGGKVGQLAKRVGMERTHLYRKLRALGVDFRQGGSED